MLSYASSTYTPILLLAHLAVSFRTVSALCSLCFKTGPNCTQATRRPVCLCTIVSDDGAATPAFRGVLSRITSLYSFLDVHVSHVKDRKPAREASVAVMLPMLMTRANDNSEGASKEAMGVVSKAA